MTCFPIGIDGQALYELGYKRLERKIGLNAKIKIKIDWYQGFEALLAEYRLLLLCVT